MNKTPFLLSSELVLKKYEDDFLSLKKIVLLENVRDYGSMAKAAKASGISYKTAWNWIDKMNVLSPSSLVEKVSGGKDGGGTIITSYATNLISIYHEVEALHQKHLEGLQASFSRLEDDITQKTFSFSRLAAEICKININDNNVEYTLQLKCGLGVIAYSNSIFKKINKLEVGSNVFILVESDAVSVSKVEKVDISSRNRLQTKISDILIKDKDVLLTLMLSEDQYLTSRITLKSFQNLQLEIGNDVMAMFKAYNVTLLKNGD